jgi:N-acetylmuramoyl-L-alanine amidase
MKPTRRLLLWLACLVSSPAMVAQAASVDVFFFQGSTIVKVQRQVPDTSLPVRSAMDALTAGPSAVERAQGITSAIPETTVVTALTIDGPRVTVELSRSMLSDGLDELRLESTFRQVTWTLRQFGLAGDARLTVDGKLLSSYLPSPPRISPRPPRRAADTSTFGALSGHSITLSPGHGNVWNGNGWPAQRPDYCAPLNSEDYHNLEMCQYLLAYLQADGMTVHTVRCTDKTYGRDPLSGYLWWQVGAYAWLKLNGYPCSVYASYTNDCTIGTGSNEQSDDVWSRPLSSDLDGTDIYISLHTNGYKGNCYGTGCPTGTETYYDAGEEHAAWGEISQTLATSVSTSIINTIVAHVDSTWVCNTDCVKNSNGAYGEIRIPDRAAILIELGFHDSCDRDADPAHLLEEYFRSASMWAIYKGVCDYFGTTPTWGIYSDEYVSDTIPSEMVGDQEYNVGITLRNHGAVWSELRGFRLGAINDNDPFATTTRINPSTEVGPGREYTFRFTLKAPRAPGIYTTAWQMLRLNGTWFGDTATRVIDVKPPWTPGDHDHDGDVDQIDFGFFQSCMTGTTVPQNDEACTWARLDGDSDVDQGDFAIFLKCLHGPDVTVDYTCAD